MKSKGSILQLATTHNLVGTNTVTLPAQEDEFWTISRITASGGSGPLTVTAGSTVILDVDFPMGASLDLDYHESVLHNEYNYNEPFVISCPGAKLNVRYR